MRADSSPRIAFLPSSLLLNMVQTQPDNTHALKAFGLSGKVAAVTGTCVWLYGL